ncbi:alpha/beta hydrolase-fold protein [Streptomyces violaceusniger]|uniref:alpha/beta hydrolase n=1 Tax=Streptomyces violaceusniger TaxID=68280 RepID=UPI00342B82AF
MRDFERRVERGESDALGELRAALEAARGPLIEELPDGRHLVTFVYIGEAERVAVDSHLFLATPQADPYMRRVPGTQVWHRSIEVADDRLSVTYRFLVNSRTAGMTVREIEEMTQTQQGHTRYAEDRHLSCRHDPYNPDRIKLDGRITFANDPEVLKRVNDIEELVRWDSVLTLPNAPRNPTLFDGEAVPEGRLTTHTLPSATFGDERQITVYRPAASPPERQAYSLLLVLDGPGAISMGVPELLDRLAARNRIRPTLAAFVHNKNSWSRSVEMVCNPKLAEQYGDEILPWLREHYPVTEDPARTVVSGGSYGGLGSAWLAHSRPEQFGNVLSLSGSYWWGLRTAYDPTDTPIYGYDDEPEWLTRQYAQTARRDVRFFLAAGTLENQNLPGGITLLSANRHLRTVLQAKGYDVRYHEFHGGHDRAGWRSAFFEGLQQLLAPA